MVYVGLVSDAHGNEVESWAPPVDWRVHGYASGANDERADGTRDLSMVLWTVYAPATGLPSVQDHVMLQGGEYAIEGDPQDYSHDPWGHGIGGAVVYLKKVNG